uniref:Uncharacterized protein n=1 Tax=Arundo donax TaxID=35708 RepID=A0A0A9F2F2_ARUDO
MVLLPNPLIIWVLLKVISRLALILEYYVEFSSTNN